MDNLEKAHAFYGMAKNGALMVDEYGLPFLFFERETVLERLAYCERWGRPGYSPVRVFIVVEGEA